MTSEPTIINKRLNRKRTGHLVEEMLNNSLPCMSWYFPPVSSSNEIIDNLPLDSSSIVIPDTMLDKAVRSRTGFVLFARWDHNKTSYTLIIPPVPVPGKSVSHEVQAIPLVEMLNTDYHAAIVLVRLGNYAIGVACGEKLIASKVGSGLVHGRHRQGGSSQKRFARHRDKQIEAFMGRICNRAKVVIEPHVNNLDYIIYGGAWTTIRELKKQCPFLTNINKPELPPILDIPDPKSRVLSDTLEKMWSCVVFQWTDDKTPKVLDI